MRAPPTACWMVRLTSRERSCSRSQTDRNASRQPAVSVAYRVADSGPIVAHGDPAPFVPPFSARCLAMRFDMRGIDHLHVRRSSLPGKLPEQIFPDAAPVSRLPRLAYFSLLRYMSGPGSYGFAQDK